MLSGFSSDSDLISLTVDVDSLAELDDGMASNHSSPSRAVGLCLTSEPPIQSTVASEQEWSKPEGERESHGLFSGSLKPKPGKQDYLEKAGELIKLALKKEEEEDYETAFSFYRKGVDLLLEGVQGMDLPILFVLHLVMGIWLWHFLSYICLLCCKEVIWNAEQCVPGFHVLDSCCACETERNLSL